ncbi:MAG TPA: phosphatase PAP2 family protein, partial [Thermoanaerobaculia bacterium]|nr:phosphatase PAP2 family protein [Thermoanaerobaculia bacterium]
GQLSMLAVAAGLVAAGAGCRALGLALSGGADRARLYLSRMTRPAALAGVARFLVAITLVSWSYSWLKVFVPRLNGWVTDPLLATLDLRIHFGISPNRFLIELFPSAGFWRFLDLYYAQFLLTMGVAFAWFGSALSRRDRGRFAAGFALLWIAGAWIYVAVPSLGPCYVFPDEYAAVRPAMPLQTQTQRLLLVQYDAVTKGSEALRKTGINSAFGIGAMPSLHVAGQAFVAFFARRRSPRLGFLFGLFAVLTLAGSLISGWHYAVDGYAGILLAWGAWRLGERMG